MGSNDRDHCRGTIEKGISKEIAIAIQTMTSRKAARLFELCAEIIVASGEVGIDVKIELCQCLLDGN